MIMNENNDPVAVPPQPGAPGEKSTGLPVRQSLGERLSPLLVMVMECCLVYALLLVMAGFFAGNDGPLLPIWAIFLVVFFYSWLSHIVKLFMGQIFGASLPQGLRRTLLALVLGSSVLVSLICCVWLRFYAQTFALFDPAWIQALNLDPGQPVLDLQILVLGFLFTLLAWLSYQASTEKSNAALLLAKGSPLFLILAGVSLSEGLLRSSPDYWQSLLLLQAFVWFGLLSQALQKASAQRRYHAVGLVESTRYQERIIFQVLVALGLMAVIANVVALFIGGNLSMYIPHTNPFTRIMPGIHVSPSKIPPPDHSDSPLNFPHIALPLTQFEVALSVVSIVLASMVLLCLLAGTVYLLLRYMKRARRKKQRERKDERKSLWNWALFLRQCKALLFSMLVFLRLLRRKSESGDGDLRAENWQVLPEVRSVREVYQAFLEKATRQGYPREKNETPYEFRQRLQGREPLLEPELETITEAYALARYAGAIPRRDEITRIQELWQTLDRKWREKVE